MKYFLYILIAAISFSSCSSTYYYSTLSTNDEGIDRDEAGSFIFDTDTIQIAYSFNGQDGPIQISVHNKLDKPIYIDWSRSAIIINDIATGYHGEESHLTNQSIDISTYPDSSTTKITSSGYEYHPDYVSFIPPMRKIEHCSLWLSNLNFSYIRKKEYASSILHSSSNQKVKVKMLNFSEENTPLLFDSYLTVFLEDGSTYTVTQSFYITNLIKTKRLRPSKLPINLAQRKDIMLTYIKANNRGWKVLAIGGIIIGSTILDMDMEFH